jgi:hypothetical protein
VKNFSTLKRAASDDITPTSAKRSKVKNKKSVSHVPAETPASHVQAKTPSKTFTLSQIIQRTPNTYRDPDDFSALETLDDLDDEMDKITW